MYQPYLLFAILLITMALFIWGRWRYDVVALFALVLSVLVGIIPFSKVFSGFSNPAVITVASVMILTQAIIRSGVVDFVVKKLAPLTSKHLLLHVATLTVVAGFLSAFMNNVAALALMMPVAIQTSIKNKNSPSAILMPLAFGSILGGLVTGIGTPPNILIASYREQLTGHAFSMFDFSPVGLPVAIAGIVLILVAGIWLVPHRRKGGGKDDTLFKIEDYLAEVKVPSDSSFVGRTVRQLEKLSENQVDVIAIVRDGRRRLSNLAKTVVEEGDILIVESPHRDLQKFLQSGKLDLVESITEKDKKTPTSMGEFLKDKLRSEDIGLIEVVIPPGSKLEGRLSGNLRLRSRFRISLLAIARQGSSLKQKRLREVALRAGDVVLLQGDAGTLQETAISLGFLPLVERGVQVGMKLKKIWPIVIFAMAIVVASMQILPVAVAFVAAIVCMLLFNFLPVRTLYDSIDWSIVILLGAMIPIGGALQATGAADLITSSIVSLAGQYHPIVILTLLLIITMTLSDFMNNAATTVVMAPIAVGLAEAMHVHVDPFLMAVAVGASSSFLTPIGHQNNVLVMGPGGYRFFDYFRLGLPLEIIVIVVAIPSILMVWPLH